MGSISFRLAFIQALLVLVACAASRDARDVPESEDAPVVATVEMPGAPEAAGVGGLGLPSDDGIVVPDDCAIDPGPGRLEWLAVVTQPTQRMDEADVHRATLPCALHETDDACLSRAKREALDGLPDWKVAEVRIGTDRTRALHATLTVDGETESVVVDDAHALAALVASYVDAGRDVTTLSMEMRTDPTARHALLVLTRPGADSEPATDRLALVRWYPEADAPVALSTASFAEAGSRLMDLQAEADGSYRILFRCP